MPLCRAICPCAVPFVCRFGIDMNNNPHHPMTAQVLAAVQLISRKPRSSLELAELLGCSRQTTDRYISLMVDEGLVTQIGREKRSLKGPAARVYAWVPVEATC